MIPSRKRLEEARRQGFRIYGYFTAFCDLNPSCEECDSVVYFWCRVRCLIERIQTRRIKKICSRIKEEGDDAL